MLTKPDDTNFDESSGAFKHLPKDFITQLDIKHIVNTNTYIEHIVQHAFIYMRDNFEDITFGNEMEAIISYCFNEIESVVPSNYHEHLRYRIRKFYGPIEPGSNVRNTTWNVILTSTDGLAVSLSS